MSLLSISGGLRRMGLILVSAGLAGALAFWYFTFRTPPIPRRTLRIGFEQVPPVQIRTDSGFAGLAVEIVSEAAKRAGVSLQWVETGTSSDEAFRRGLVDLWPIMADLPDRRKRVHITRPWLHTNHTLVLRAGSAFPDRGFTGRIALFKMPLHVRLAGKEFPEAHLVQFSELLEVLKEVCRGTVSAGFLEDRGALAALREKPAECAQTELRVETLPALTLQLGVASTFQAAGAADKIRGEIGNLFRDGTLAATMAKYSYYGLDDTWTTYDLMEAAEHARWIAWGISGLAMVLALGLWRAASLRQRKQSAAAVRESEERFRRVFEEGPLGLGLVGKDYHFLKVNSALCRMVGYSEAELTPMSFKDITHPDDVEANVELADRLFRREIPFYRMTKRYVRKSGEIIWVKLTASLIHDEKGMPLYGLAMIEDITEVKRGQEEALVRQKLESLGVLAGGIAHDFNNLLGGILAEAELVLLDLPADSSCAEEVQRIKTVAIRGSEIVRELMIYSGQDKADLVEAVDVSRLVEEMLELLKLSISKHAALKADLRKNLPAVRGSAPQIRQIVMNLVINASEAIGDKDGVIKVTTSRITRGKDLAPNSATDLPESDYLQLEVSDTGRGMTEEVKAKIFDPFFTTKFVGRGLGLAVVRAIVRDHGGAINLVSGPGRGTTFQIFLPCVGETAQVSRSAIAPASGAELRPSGRTVLVVEDEVVLRLAVSTMLRKRGFSVIEAGDGSAAMDLIRAHKDDIDVVLLDVTLPGVSSRKVLEETRHMRPELKVILTSAHSKETVDASFAGLRIERFIRKPFQLTDLMGLLQDALSA